MRVVREGMSEQAWETDRIEWWPKQWWWNGNMRWYNFLYIHLQALYKHNIPPLVGKLVDSDSKNWDVEKDVAERYESSIDKDQIRQNQGGASYFTKYSQIHSVSIDLQVQFQFQGFSIPFSTWPCCMSSMLGPWMTVACRSTQLRHISARPRRCSFAGSSSLSIVVRPCCMLLMLGPWTTRVHSRVALWSARPRRC